MLESFHEEPRETLKLAFQNSFVAINEPTGEPRSTISTIWDAILEIQKTTFFVSSCSIDSISRAIHIWQELGVILVQTSETNGRESTFSKNVRSENAP